MIAVRALAHRRIARELAFPVGGAAHRTARRALVEIVLDAGELRGRGEAAPLPGYSLDTLEEVEHALDAFAARLPFHYASLAEVETACASHPPAARAALETALLDLLGQATGRPLHALLGTATPSVPLCAVLHDADPAAEAAALIDAGYRTLKRKIDGASLAPLLAIRGAQLRLDANRGLSAAQLDALRPALRELPIELIEEPLDADLALAAPPGLPIALDESLAARDAAGALRALERHAPAIRAQRIVAVVLKPVRDGLLGARRLAQAARAMGAGVLVTHLWDGALGHLAAAHLALALGSTEHAHGLAPQPGWGDDAARTLLEASIRDGVLHAPRAPGLGIDRSRSG